MNEHDSEIMAGMLIEEGFQQVESRKEADIVIINTCSIRDNADKRFFGTLGQLKRRKKENPEFTVCVCGCMMQQQHVIDTIKAKYPWVDVIFGTHNIHRLPELLANIVAEKGKQLDVWPEGGEIVEGLPCERLHKSKALVNIMFGCNNFCTYCIVPYTRGRERSRRPDDILGEVKNLVADGVKEIMLLGQNVNSYKGIKTDSADEICDFADLIYMLNEVEGLERIRFMTSHPKDLSDKLIQAFVDCDKLCKNIHLPVQSGSSRILKAMNRRYDKEKYLELVKKLKAAVPGITMSTDIIVGFPGETEEDFAELLDFVEKQRFENAGVFQYSQEEGTVAGAMENQIAPEIKENRYHELMALQAGISEDIHREREEAELEVLVEGFDEDNLAYGRSTHEAPDIDGTIFIENAEGLKVGDMVRVRILQGFTYEMVAERI